METMTANQKEPIVWRAAIFNQIFTTRYFHARKYLLNSATGKYHPTADVVGHRGPGGNLGYTSRGEAAAEAARLNKRDQ